MANQLTLFYTPPTHEQIAKGKHFLQVCEDVARVLGLKKASQESIAEHIKRADVDYERLMQEVDER